MNVPILSDTVSGDTTQPHGCEPTETIVPFTKSTSSNISGYCFLASSSSVSTKLLNSFAKDTYS